MEYRRIGNGFYLPFACNALERIKFRSGQDLHDFEFFVFRLDIQDFKDSIFCESLHSQSFAVKKFNRKVRKKRKGKAKRFCGNVF